MKPSKVVRRVFGDLVGLGSLAVMLAGILSALPGEFTDEQFKNGFLQNYIILSIVGYMLWVSLDTTQAHVWVSIFLFSICLGILIFLSRMLIYYFTLWPSDFHERAITLSLIKMRTACPGLTLVAVSGWARSIIVGGDGQQVEH